MFEFSPRSSGAAVWIWPILSLYEPNRFFSDSGIPSIYLSALEPPTWLPPFRLFLLCAASSALPPSFI